MGKSTGRRLTEIATGILLLTVAFLFVACGGGRTEATPTPTAMPVAGTTPTGSTPPPSPSSFEQEWEALIAAAREEGQLNILMGGSASRVYQPVAEEFETKFGIDVSVLGGSTTSLTERILAERGAGKYTQDIAMAGAQLFRRWVPAGALDPIEAEFVHPEVTDKSLWAGDRYWWRDVEESQFLFQYSGDVTMIQGTPWYNTDLVTQADLDQINSIWDFLEPNWKGKLVAAVPLPEGSGMGNFYAHPDIGEEWLRRFITEMDVEFIDDVRLIVDTLARGRKDFGINLGKAGTELSIARDQGLPVDDFVKPLKERPVLSRGSSSNIISVVNRRPNPAAAKLFVNWFLTREGQTVMQGKAEAPVDPSLRVDVTEKGQAEGLSAVEALAAGVEFIVPDDEWEQLQTEGDEWAIELWNATRGGR